MSLGPGAIMRSGRLGGHMPADMSGRAALITGAASGIGRASAIAFAAAGASVALIDIDADGLEDAAAVFGRLDAAHNDAGVPGTLCSPG